MKVLINKEGFFGCQLIPEGVHDRIAYVILRVMYIFFIGWCILHVLPLICVLALNWLFTNTIHVHVPYNWYTWTGAMLFFIWIYYHDVAQSHR